MSRLANPGAGDITDRLTVLALKILFGGAAGKDTSYWEKERSQLLPKLPSAGAFLEHVFSLAAVNAALWHAEDDMRALRAQAATWRTIDSTGLTGREDVTRRHQAAGELGFRIQELNDRRAELISLINSAAGDERGEEKV